MSTSATRRAVYAKIAIARKQLPDMDEEAYRALLEARFGTRHASELSEAQLTRLIGTFAGMGVVFVSKTGGKPRGDTKPKALSRPDWVEITDAMPFAAQKRQMCAIWTKMGYNLNALDTRVKRAYGVDRFVWIKDPEQITALLSDLQRRERAFDRKQARQAHAEALA